jgi:hypothetical protein
LYNRHLVELDADAVARMGLQNVLQFHLRVEVDVNAALKTKDRCFDF